MPDREDYAHINTQDHPVVEGRLMVHIECATCDRETVIDTAAESFNHWMTQTMLSQEIWPELAYSVRRWLTEAVCPDCADRPYEVLYDEEGPA